MRETIQEMDNKGLKKTKELFNTLLEKYYNDDIYKVVYHPLPDKGKRVDAIIKITMNGVLIKVIAIETKIRNFNIDMISPKGLYKEGLMIERDKYNLFKAMETFCAEKYGSDVKFYGIYLNFLKDKTVMFDLTGINVDFSTRECNKTTHAINNSRTEKSVGFLPLSKGTLISN